MNSSSKKHIIMTGATGLVGTALFKVLRNSGYRITVLSRNPSAAANKLPDARKHILWAPGVAGEWQQAVDGAYAVIHLAGESLFGERWTKRYKKVLYDSRVMGTTEIAEAIRESNEPPKVFISASAVGFYGGTGDTVVNESAGPGKDFLAQLCVDWESAAKRAASENTRVATPRFAPILADGEGALSQMVPIFKLGLGGWFGNGRQYFPWVHVNDVVASIRFILENERMEGPVNISAPGDVTNKDFSKALGKALHRPVVFPVPGWALRLVLGEFAYTLLYSQRIEPRRLKEDGYVFKFPELKPAFTDLL